MDENAEYVRAFKTSSLPIRAPADFEPLIRRLARARIVMLGEATHGTHEFYEVRRIISEWLIARHGFRFIAVEGDWPACSALDRTLQGTGAPAPREALEAFRRWPTWMWANTDVIRLAEWLGTHNRRLAAGLPKVHFHGLDVYSLFESMHEVVEQLKNVNPFLARRAAARYQCFDPFQGNEKSYARSLLEHAEGCREEVLDVLGSLLKLRLGGIAADLDSTGEALFDARQNARIVNNAERYYRALIEADEDSWNVRDRHMLEMLDELLSHYSVPGSPARAIVWAHNTHVGDYRATDMAREGLVNLGGLAREKYGDSQVALVGFGTFEGTVTASPAWDGPVIEMKVPPGRENSVEAASHEVARELKAGTFVSLFGDRTPGVLEQVRDHRAIGVVYDPRRERWGNYVPSALSRRYDGFVFLDHSSALQPLIQGVDTRELPETWPRGQ